MNETYKILICIIIALSCTMIVMKCTKERYACVECYCKSTGFTNYNCSSESDLKSYIDTLEAHYGETKCNWEFK